MCALPKSILICDDSLFMRTTLKRIINEDMGFTIIGMARDGLEGVEMSSFLKPDIITMDLQMPKMDGVTAIARILEKYPIPILVVSSFAKSTHENTIKALENGAVDYVLKPGDDLKNYLDKESFFRFKEQLLAKLHICSEAKVKKLATKLPPLRAGKIFQKKHLSAGSGSRQVVVIGSSTGGPQVLAQMLSQFPADFPAPIFVCQHMHFEFTRSLAARLAKVCSLRAKLAEQDEIIKGGTIYILPGNRNLEIVSTNCETIYLSRFFENQIHKPSIDVLFISAVEVYGSSTRGCILTGMGEDGILGMQKIIDAGGVNFAQDEDSCAVFGMPSAAIKKGLVYKICSPMQFAGEIMTSFEVKKRVF
ncbi:chemotaxis-specific protein-glutamate methyltransferase CheB [Candidatus Riflebacteria bacterium]